MNSLNQCNQRVEGMRRINKKKTKKATHFSLPFESLSNRHEEVFNECLSPHDCCQDVVEDSANDG